MASGDTGFAGTEPEQYHRVHRNGGANGHSNPNNGAITRNASNTSDTSETIGPTSNYSIDAYLTKEGKEEAEDSSDEIRRGSSSSTVNREAYQPVQPGDRETLTRLASHLSRNQSYLSRRDTKGTSDGLERQDTLAGLEWGDPVFDPNSPKFDFYKWLRMTVRMMDKDDIKIKRAGIVLKDVNISGSGSALNLQQTVGSFLQAPLRIGTDFRKGKTPVKSILRNVDGVLKSSEMLIVLGRPGSGCSTLLKTMTGELNGLAQSEDSTVHYNGITQKQMLKEFKGEVVYNQEVDKHFPHLTVGQTLEHAAALRMPSHRAMNVGRQELVKHFTQVVMAIFGLSHTYNTKVCRVYPSTCKSGTLS